MFRSRPRRIDGRRGGGLPALFFLRSTVQTSLAWGRRAGGPRAAGRPREIDCCLNLYYNVSRVPARHMLYGRRRRRRCCWNGGLVRVHSVCMFDKVFASFPLLTRKNSKKKEKKACELTRTVKSWHVLWLVKIKKHTSIDTLGIEMTCIN